MLGPKFILLSACKDSFFQKKSYKVHVFMALGSGPSKMVLALLNKLVAFHIGSTIIQIGVSSFQ